MIHPLSRVASCVHGSVPRYMSFELHQRKHIEDELAKIVRRELRQIARALTASADSTFESAVHESRKGVKKVRAVAAILKQAGAKLPRKDRKRLKSAARALSRLRDSAAIVDAFDGVRRQYPKQLSEHTYGILRRGLVGARHREQARAQRDGVVGEVAERLVTTRKSAKHWASRSIDMPGIVAVIAASYRQSRAAMQRARATGQSATLHRWRKELQDAVVSAASGQATHHRRRSANCGPQTAGDRTG